MDQGFVFIFGAVVGAVVGAIVGAVAVLIFIKVRQRGHSNILENVGMSGLMGRQAKEKAECLKKFCNICAHPIQSG